MNVKLTENEMLVILTYLQIAALRSDNDDAKSQFLKLSEKFSTQNILDENRRNHAK